MSNLRTYLRYLAPALVAVVGVVGIVLRKDAPACELPQAHTAGTGTQDEQSQEAEDERIYYVGCGGMF